MNLLRALAVFCTLLISPSLLGQYADLVLRGGTVITVDERLGNHSAVAVRGDRIIAVGSNLEIGSMVGENTRVVELNGRIVIPGFIEGHAHFMGIGDAVQNLDLMSVRNWDEVVQMVAEAAKNTPPGEWIRGRGWHQEKWDRPPEDAVEGFPRHDSLSSVSPDNPVMLTHASGHAAFFNAAAMALAGIDAETKDPPGGDILRDDQGEAIGAFREKASELVARVFTSAQIRRSPEEARAAARRTAALADQECLRNGVTSFQDAGSTLNTVDFLTEYAQSGALKTRLWIMIRDSNRQLASRVHEYKRIGVANHRLTVRALKRSIDGALGPRGAWLLEPYSDSPESTGLNTATVESVTQTAQIAAEHGFQMCVHAIGDRANREVLDLFAKIFADRPEMVDPRWRIEHAQHLEPSDIPRFAELGVIASMQGVHCTSDAPYVTPRLGAKRASAGAYVWQSLLRSGAVVTNGTDAPVEDIDPIASYYATVTRKMASGEAFYPEQSMSREEALASYTKWAAWAAFEEDLKGTLTPGKLADLVVLNQNLLTVPDEDILDTEIHYTIVGGEVVHVHERAEK